MAGYDTAALTAVLKPVFEETTTDLVTRKSFLLDELERANPKEFPGGKQLVWEVDVAPNTSYAIGNMDGGELPDPGRRVHLQASADIVDHDGSCGTTQDALDRAKGNEASFFRLADKIQKDLVSDLRNKKINPQLYKQQLWVVTADSTGTTVTLDNVQYINVGDVLTFGNRTTGATPVAKTVTAKNIAAKTVTLDTAVTVTAAASGAWYAGAGPADTKVMESLDRAASTGRTLHGIDSTVYPAWDGNTIDLASGGTPQAADEGDVVQLLNQMWERDNNEVTSAITTIGIQRRIADGLLSQKRFNDAQSVNLHAGYKGLMIGAANTEIALVAERDVPKGRLFAYDKKAMRLYKGPQEFLELNGGIWRYIRNANGRATSAYAATYRVKLNLLIDNPAGVGRLINCQDDAPVWNG
jgi:hypothetical protein